MTDLVTGLATVLGEAVPKEGREHFQCTFQLGLIVSSTLASVYSIGLIGVDRFLYILYGLHYQKWVYPNRTRTVIALSWILGCIIGYLPLMGWHEDETNGKKCWFILIAPKEQILLTVIIGVMPLLTNLVLYSTILYHAIKKIIEIKKSGHLSGTSGRVFHGNTTETTVEEPEPKGFFKLFKKKPSSSVNSPKKWKAIKVVLFTTGSFAFTWGPYFVVSIMYAFQCDKHNETPYCSRIRILLASPLAILGFLNSFLNPIIYAWWHNGFRKFVKSKISTFRLKTININHSQSQTTTSQSQLRNEENPGPASLDTGTTLDRRSFDQAQLQIETD